MMYSHLVHVILVSHLYSVPPMGYTKSGSKGVVPIVVGVVAASIILLGILGLLLWFRGRNKQLRETKNAGRTMT